MAPTPENTPHGNGLPDSGRPDDGRPMLRVQPMVAHPDRFDVGDPANGPAVAAHDAAVAAGQGGYLDPVTGLFVMTALGLVNRGTCCANGCRHCPYVISIPM